MGARARTNYFRVKNPPLFKAWVESHKDLRIITNEIFEGPGSSTVVETLLGLASDTDDGDWPSWYQTTAITAQGSIVSGLTHQALWTGQLSAEGDESDMDHEHMLDLLKAEAESHTAWDADQQPTLSLDEESVHVYEEDHEINLAAELALHLEDGEVAILMSCSYEKLRYVSGEAMAINNKGETKRISLHDIYALAQDLGTHITEAVY